MPHTGPRRQGSGRVAVAGAAVGALVAAPVAAWAATDFSDVPSTHWAYTAIQRVTGAGIMTGTGNGEFRPSRKVSRAGLASGLYGALSRLSVDRTVGDIPADTTLRPAIAEVLLGIGGYEPANQGILLQLTMQVEVASPLAADCDLTLYATSWPENLEAGEWTTSLHAGDRGASVQAVFTDSQLDGTLYTYEVTADHDCEQALGVVQGALVGQTAALTGNGQPFGD